MNVFRAVIFACVMGMVHGQYSYNGNSYNTCGELAATDFGFDSFCFHNGESSYYTYDAIISSNTVIGNNYLESACCTDLESTVANLRQQVTNLQNNNVCASGSGQSDACDQRILAEYNKTQIIALYNKGVEQGKFNTCG